MKKQHLGEVIIVFVCFNKKQRNPFQQTLLCSSLKTSSLFSSQKCAPLSSLGTQRSGAVVFLVGLIVFLVIGWFLVFAWKLCLVSMGLWLIYMFLIVFWLLVGFWFLLGNYVWFLWGCG